MKTFLTEKNLEIFWACRYEPLAINYKIGSISITIKNNKLEISYREDDFLLIFIYIKECLKVINETDKLTIQLGKYKSKNPYFYKLFYEISKNKECVIKHNSLFLNNYVLCIILNDLEKGRLV